LRKRFIIALLSSLAGGGAAAQSPWGGLSYATERACSLAGRLGSEECANAAANARAEFDEKAPRFPTREVCQKLFPRAGCSLGFSGADGFVGRKSAVYFTPRQLGFRVSTVAKTATPYTDPPVGFSPRTFIRRDTAIDLKRARAATAPVAWRAAPAPDLSGRGGFIALVRQEAEKAALPVDVADAVAYVESRYDPSVVGDVGEIGLMQVRPATAAMLGFDGGESELFDPATNIHYGVRYLAQAWRLAGGDLCRALMKYRSGHGSEEMSPLSVQYCARARSYLESLKSELAKSPLPAPSIRIAAAASPLSCAPGVGHFAPRCPVASEDDARHFKPFRITTR
jgi:hypothetical protein